MSLSSLAARVGKSLADNSPTILTVVGVVGTVGTAILAGKGGFNAAHILAGDDRRRHRDQLAEATYKEMFWSTWRCYVPAVVCGTLTVSAIVCMNRIGARRAAALAAAYSLSERTWQEYQHKVIEKIGEKKEHKIWDEVAQDKVSNDPPPPGLVITTGEVLCYDTISGRYFKSDMETMRKAVNDLNKEIISNSYASLNEFWALVGLTPTEYGNEVGWKDNHLLDVNFSAVLSENNQPCISLLYDYFPVRNYYKLQ